MMMMRMRMKTYSRINRDINFHRFKINIYNLFILIYFSLPYCLTTEFPTKKIAVSESFFAPHKLFFVLKYVQQIYTKNYWKIDFICYLLCSENSKKGTKNTSGANNKQLVFIKNQF